MDLLEDYLHHLEKVDPIHMAQLGVAGIISGSGKFDDAQKLLETFCNEEYENDPVRMERCKSLRYSKSGINYTSESLAVASAIVTGGIVSALIAKAHKKYEDVYGRANRACARLKGKEGKICRKNYKIEAAKAEIQALKFARSRCRQSKDPKQCVQQINQRIKTIEGKHRGEIHFAGKAV